MNKDSIFNRMLRYRMKGRLQKDAPLACETTFKIGGPADILFFPESIAEAVRVVKLCNREQIPLTVLGGGANVLVRDGGVRGIVMKLAGLCEMRRERGRDCVFAGAGAALAGVSAFAMSESLSGLEFACGIPGSVGGAVYMNAGAYGREMKDVVRRSVVLEPDGNIGLLDGAGHGFTYRGSAFQKNGCIILETEFCLAPSDKDGIERMMDEYKARREASQPLDMPSAGSVFRRPGAGAGERGQSAGGGERDTCAVGGERDTCAGGGERDTCAVGGVRRPGEGGGERGLGIGDGTKEVVYVGPMIEKCGLKGVSIGGAQVSEKHAGFIVNRGGATAADVLALIDRVRSAVKERFGVELATEIRIIGE